MKHNASKQMALGGVLAALAVVIMCLGGMIPGSTFVCPMFCIMMVQLVRKLCGRKTAWTWYAAVALLSILLGPDKEAAAVFVFLGYYPLVKPWLDRRKLSILWKLVFFNVVILAMYTLLINLLGMAELSEEFAEAGMILTAVTLLLGNITFVILDMILARAFQKR